MTDGLIAVILDVAVRSLADFVLCKWIVDLQVDAAFGLLDAQHDALQVFVFALHIRARVAFDDVFAGFHDVAGLIFVGNAQRNDVHVHEILHEILSAAHIHHLQQALFRGVDAVLGASLALGNPHGSLAGRDGFTDIGA